jgi:hypothetical protein
MCYIYTITVLSCVLNTNHSFMGINQGSAVFFPYSCRSRFLVDNSIIVMHARTHTHKGNINVSIGSTRLTCHENNCYFTDNSLYLMSWHATYAEVRIHQIRVMWEGRGWMQRADLPLPWRNHRIRLDACNFVIETQGSVP